MNKLRGPEADKQHKPAMTALNDLQSKWEGFAQKDALWAICTDPNKRDQKWNEEEFFLSGKNEVEKVLAHLFSLGIQPDFESSALDFGCGVGRLTRALSAHFAECWGIDISPTMVEMAGDFHKHIPNCNFVVNPTDELRSFPESKFSFIYTSIVLQHIKRRYVERYLAEFMRVLKPGGILVFQIPDRNATGIVDKIRKRLKFRTRQNYPSGLTDRKFRMEMHCLPESRIKTIISAGHARIVDVRLTNSADASFNGNLKYLTEEPQTGFVSKQYCVVKDDAAIAR